MLLMKTTITAKYRWVSLQITSVFSRKSKHVSPDSDVRLLEQISTVNVEVYSVFSEQVTSDWA